MRICSFLPSATEIVYALGAGEDLCGITYECDYPPDVRRKPVIVESRIRGEKLESRAIDAQIKKNYQSGQSTYVINRELLRQADPDVILTQELCDVCAASPTEVVAAVRSLTRIPKIITLTPQTLEGIFLTILQVGEAINKPAAAENLVASLRERVSKVQLFSEKVKIRPRLVCLEWLDPIYCAGHWIPEMVAMAGGEDGFGRKGEKSHQIDWAQVLDYDPEIIILMPCGFDIPRTLREITSITRLTGWSDLRAVLEGNIFSVDASSYFSRPGPRIVVGLEILAKIIRPESPFDIPASSMKRLELRSATQP